jgi:hypothetical protein
MYRYLDRPLATLGTPERLLVWAMRHWVQSISAGRCPCAALGPAFRKFGVDEAVGDFNIFMLVLNGKAQATIRFAPVCFGHVNDDEAKLLALYDAGARNAGETVLRMAEQLVRPDAVRNLATAVERTAATVMDAAGQAER